MRSFATPPASAGSAALPTSVPSRPGSGSRCGSCAHRTLQAAWNQHGPDAFSPDIIERIEDEALAYVRDGILKDRRSHWCSTFGADPM
jgi:hypothetical protein